MEPALRQIAAQRHQQAIAADERRLRVGIAAASSGRGAFRVRGVMESRLQPETSPARESPAEASTPENLPSSRNAPTGRRDLTPLPAGMIQLWPKSQFGSVEAG